MKKIILGASGMLGHMIFYYFKKNQNDVIAYSRSNTGIDFLDTSLIKIPEYSKKYISDLIQTHRPCNIINCVGITKFNGNLKEGRIINSELPLFLSHVLDSQNDGSKLIQISTNGVFSGKRGDYIETDIPDTTDHYGKSKLKGEVIHFPHLTIRASVIGPETRSKKGLLEWFLNQNNDVPGHTEEKWNGVTTLEYAKFIEWTVNHELTGLAHLFSKKISKNELLNIIKEVYKKKIAINSDNTIKSDKTLNTIRSDIKYKVASHFNMLVELKNITF